MTAGWAGVSAGCACLLAIMAVPVLAARAVGGEPPDPRPKLAALAPIGAVLAVVSVIIAASAWWWLALLFALPATALVAWQLPPLRPGNGGSGRGPGQRVPHGSAATLRVLSLNVQGGSADVPAVMSSLRQHRVDILAVQELTPDMVALLAAADIAELLPFCHLDPRPGAMGTGIWSRWDLVPLPPVPGVSAAAPRARVNLLPGGQLTFTAVHPAAPVNGYAERWRRDLTLLGTALADADGPQVMAGDFNASRDHRPFRDLLKAGFVDCADAAQVREWPGFTWPVRGGIPPLMRLDHVLVPRAGAVVREARTVSVRGTDHRGVLAVIELPG